MGRFSTSVVDSMLRFLLFFFSRVSCNFELIITFFDNLLVPAVKSVGGGNVPDSTVEANIIVVIYVVSHYLLE